MENDCISRQAAIDALSQYPFEKVVNCISIIEELPSAQPEKMQLSTEKTQLSEEDATKDATFDYIDRQAAIDALCDNCDDVKAVCAHFPCKQCIAIEQLPSAQPERLTDDDFETIRIHLNAYKESLGNQHRWEEAEEYQRIIDRFMAFASAQPEHLVKESCNLVKGLVNDCISRQAAIDAVYIQADDDGWWTGTVHDMEELLKGLPSAQPTQNNTSNALKTLDCIDRQAAQTELMMKCERYTLAKESHGFGYVEWSSDLISVADAMDVIRYLPSAQPEHTETHECDCERTETHGWIPVTERQPNHELAIVQFSDGDFSLLQFPTAYRWKDIVAWMPLPPSYKGDEDERN